MSDAVRDMALDGSVAIFSRCRRYRYWLERPLGPAAGRTAIFIMLNPSTADAFSDDPTVARCRKRAVALGCGRLVVVNLFALRATDPRELVGHADPVGPDNDEHLQTAAVAIRQLQGIGIAAWGDKVPTSRRDRIVRALDIFTGAALDCLGTTEAGQPRHPLYIPNARELQPYRSWCPPGGRSARPCVNPGRCAEAAFCEHQDVKVLR